jgi:signal transduction histidine kinase
MDISRRYHQLRLDIKRVVYILRHSITKRLLAVVFSIYLVVTVTVTLLHMDFEYEFSKLQTIKSLKNIQTMIHDSVSQAIWEFNTPQLDTILSGLYNNQYIVGVKLEIPPNETLQDMTNKEIGLIENQDGELIQVNPQTHAEDIVYNTFERLIPLTFEIKHFDALGRNIVIGKMYLYSSNRVVFNQVKASYVLIILNAIIKTVALWVFFLWAGYYFISKPLAQLTSAIKQLASGNWGFELVSSNQDKTQKTEINTLFETFNDMTKNLRQTQIKLEQSRNRLDNIFDTMPSALASVDNKLIIQGWNKYMVQMTSIDAKQAIGQSLHKVFPGFDEYIYLINLALKKNKEQLVQHVKLNININSADRLYYIIVYPIKGTISPEVVIRIDDVTEQVKNEADMAQVEKLASVGASIAGVAHEINNPLASIMQSTQNILRRIDPEMESNKQLANQLNFDLNKQYDYLKQREIISFLDNIHQAGDRASSIVKNMLKFTRRSTQDMEPHSLIEIINDALMLAANDISIQEHLDLKEIKIIKKFNAKQNIIECIPLEIQQVILNLLRNAVQAINPDQADKIITLETEDMPDDKILLKIIDSGQGIPSDIIPKIFQPFFTTKPTGMGTGLGLSVCRNIIVQKHHGNMEVKSVVGKGTTFIITLPVHQHPTTG